MQFSLRGLLLLATFGPLFLAVIYYLDPPDRFLIPAAVAIVAGSGVVVYRKTRSWKAAAFASVLSAALLWAMWAAWMFYLLAKE